MLWDDVQTFWPERAGAVARTFPHHPLPETAPDDRDRLVSALARSHELTSGEVLEIIDDLFFLAIAEGRRDAA